MGAGKGDSAGPLTVAAAVVTQGLPGAASMAGIAAGPYMMIRGAQDQAKAAKEQTQKAADKQDQLMSDAEEKRKAQEASVASAAVRSGARQQQLSNLSAYSSTIKTSPLGIIGLPSAVGKTAIGQ